MRKGQFYIGDTGKNKEYLFEGFTSGETWNGFFKPYFTKNVGLKVLEFYRQGEMEADKHKTYFDEQLETFNFYVEPHLYEVYEATSIKFEGKDVKVFQIGNGWIWDE